VLLEVFRLAAHFLINFKGKVTVEKLSVVLYHGRSRSLLLIELRQRHRLATTLRLLFFAGWTSFWCIQMTKKACYGLRRHGRRL
jgi:hypothetical protein